MPIPLFVCHANCARSVLAFYLYQHLCPGAPALSAGVEVGVELSHRVRDMLARWGIDARGHQPRQLDRALCDEADAVLVMAPTYVHRLLLEHGHDLAAKTYLFADPFTRPRNFTKGEYRVHDPSFDSRPLDALVAEFAWMREGVLRLRLALLGDGKPMVPVADYLDLCLATDPRGH